MNSVSNALSQIGTLLGYAQPFIILIVAKTIDQEDPTTKKYCLWAFSASVFLCGILLLFIRFQINSNPDGERVIQVPEKKDPWAPPEEDEEDKKEVVKGKATPKKKKEKPVKLVPTTVREYDSDQLKTLFSTKFIMVVGITVFLYKQFGYVVPLLMQAMNGPMMVWSHQLFKIHVRGEQIKRPWEEFTPGEELARKFGLGGMFGGKK